MIATHGSVILAVAGGIVADPATYHTVLTHFHTVWVKARAEEHMGRVQAQGDLRPMAGNPEAMEQLRTLLKSREALYRQAHAELDTAGKTRETSAAELVGLIRARGFVA
ncbi:MAG: shikimate kinase [Paracoccaceae bacterium]